MSPIGRSYSVPCKGNSRNWLGSPHVVMTKRAWVTLYAGVGCNVLKDTNTCYRTHGRSWRRKNYIHSMAGSTTYAYSTHANT